MISQLAGALGAGFTTKQVMKYLIRQFPNHADKIKQALTAGYSVDQIIKFLGGGRKSVNEESQGITEHEQIRNTDIQRRENVNQKAMQGAGMAAMAGGTALAAPMLKSALQRAAPQLLGPGAVTNTPVGSQTQLPPNQAQLPNLGTQQPNPSQPPALPILPQSAQPVQAQGIGINAKEILSKYPGFESKVNDMVRSKNTPEAIAQYFKQFNASQTKKLEKETGQPIEAIIAQYLSESPEAQPNVKPALQPEIPEVKKPLSREEALGKFRDKLIAETGNETTPEPKIDFSPENKDGKSHFNYEKNNFSIDGYKDKNGRINVLGTFFKNPEGGSYAEEKDIPSSLKGKGIATHQTKQFIDELKKDGINNLTVKDVSLEGKKLWNRLLKDKKIEKIEDKFPRQDGGDLKIDFSEKPIKIEKGSTVGSPQGIGEIKAIRNGKAIVEVDGKKHQVDEDELIQSPLPEKDLADLYEDLIGGIEKSTGKQVSRNVDWAGYDPNTNELAYKPHGSDKLYAYEDIEPEDVEILTSLLTQRKSTGENFIGAWSAGTESPIGAAMYQLIKKLQASRGGKGNEYKNKFETIYDALEPAKKALKERHAERKKKAKKPRPD